jgi:hypothetical protein
MDGLVYFDAMPSEADVMLFRAQYERALNGLFEAWKFGEMMRILKAKMEGESVMEGAHAAPCTPAKAQGALPQGFGSLTREPTEKGSAVISTGRCGIVPNWRAGTGLKAWLRVHCPEVNYKTALRFLAIAEAVCKALPEGADEGTVRDYLAGKSARKLLQKPQPLTEADLPADERAEKVASVAMGFVNKLVGIYRTGESSHLSLEMRREIVTHLKTLIRQLEEEA